MYFKACTPQWQLLGQTSLIRLRSILVLCWNSAHLLSTAGIPPSSTRLHLKAILFNSLIYHKNCAAVYTNRGQTKARVPSAFGGGLLGSAPPSTPHIAEETDAAPEHAVKAKMSQGLNASVFIWQHFFPLSLSSTQILYLSRALIYRKFEMCVFSFSSLHYSGNAQCCCWELVWEPGHQPAVTQTKRDTNFVWKLIWEAINTSRQGWALS